MDFNPLQIAALLTLLSTKLGMAEVDFAHEVLPILTEHCAECHSNGKYKGSLSMDTRAALLKSETVVVGKATESEFIKLLHADDPDDRMPQKADPLPAEKIAVLAKWVNEGLAWEAGFTFKEKTWVAPLAHRKPELPAAKTENENPIDRITRAYFVKNKVAAPSTISDAAFLRRAHLDLIGLLPTADESKTFANSKSSTKRSDKITALLDSEIDYADCTPSIPAR